MAIRIYSDEERIKRKTASKRKWNERNYKQLNVQIGFDLYAKIKKDAENKGISLREYVIRRLSE